MSNAQISRTKDRDYVDKNVYFGEKMCRKTISEIYKTKTALDDNKWRSTKSAEEVLSYLEFFWTKGSFVDITQQYPSFNGKNIDVIWAVIYMRLMPSCKHNWGYL